MQVTVFNAKKTTTKFPVSPYDDDSFYFETKEVDSILDVFDIMSGSFLLDIPLMKSLKSPRRKDLLPFVEKLDYIIIDIDDLDTKSDRALAIQYFKESNFRVVLGESRTDYRLKGVLRVNNISQKEAKLVLQEIQKCIPGVVDKGSVGYANYQAPILKHRVLYDGGTKVYPKPKSIELPTIVASVPDNIQQICIDAFIQKGYSFKSKVQNGFRCSHPSEIKTPGGFSWSPEFPYTISHWNPDRRDSVWGEVIKSEEYKKHQKELSAESIRNLIPKNGFTCNMRYLNNHKEKVQEFIEESDMLKIQSPMGTAKSKVIEEVIHQARKKNLKILFVTNRISLADDIANKYDSITHYLGTEAEGNHYQRGQDLVVQVDSLHKFSIKFFDVVILDEAATTLMHLLKLEHHQKKIATQVFSLSNRKLVLADAFLFDEMAQVFNPKKITEINNSYRDDVNIKVYQQRDNFINQIIQVAQKEPLSFSSGSIVTLKVVALLLDQLGISHQTIQADTPKSTREAIYKAFNKKDPFVQVLMYSPSLTVGVSNLNSVRHHFHFDSGLSMDVLSSLQMTKRTRSALNLHLFLSERIKYAPTDLPLIQNSLTDFHQQDQDGDDVGISEAGAKYSKLQKINNILENRHKISFLTLLKLQFTTNIKHDKTKVPSFLHKMSKVVQEIEKDHKLDVFEIYKKMSPDELSDIELKLFARSKDEQFIKEFSDIKEDETLQDISDSLKLILTKEEIIHPGTIQALKMNLKTPEIYNNSRNGNYSQLEIKSLKISLKDYHFKKNKNIYTITPVIKKILDSLKGPK